MEYYDIITLSTCANPNEVQWIRQAFELWANEKELINWMCGVWYDCYVGETWNGFEMYHPHKQ